MIILELDELRCIVHHTLWTVYLHYSVYTQKHKRNINWPAFQQAESLQATQTSAAASAALSKVSVPLRTSTVSTPLRTQAWPRQRPSKNPIQRGVRGVKVAAGSVARRQSMTSGGS